MYGLFGRSFWHSLQTYPGSFVIDRYYSNRFANAASPGVLLMCAELMLAELTVLMLAELNDFPDSDIIDCTPY